MSSDIIRTLRRIGTVASALAIVTVLAACQVRPLYGESSTTGAELASVAFSDATNRVEQVVRNQLIFLSTGGKGEATNPAYQVNLTVVSIYSDILDDESASALQPGRVVVSGNYTLTRLSDGVVIGSGARNATALLDISRQEFAEVRAVRDAESRAARELAEFINADLALKLVNQPPPPVTWQK